MMGYAKLKMTRFAIWLLGFKRAIRRCGELLKEIEPATHQYEVEKRAKDAAVACRKQAAQDAGLSKRQKATALRVAVNAEP